jgi:hypothetical protein
MLRVNHTLKKYLLQSKNIFSPLINTSVNYSASYDDWKKVAKAQLKDKPAESLISKTAEVKNLL